MDTNDRVLFVDDDQEFLNAIVRSLRNKYDITTCINPLDALSLSHEKGPFAVVVSDFRMPDLDGVKYLELMKKAFPESERILLTGYPEVNIAVDAVNNARVHAILTKPCPIGKVETEIQAALKKYNSMQLIRESYRTTCDRLGMQIEHTSERLRQEVQHREKDMHRLYVLMQKVLAAKDQYTFVHSVRVSDLAGNLAHKLGYSETDVQRIQVAGLLHDVGKIYVPSDVLNKPDKLSLIEWDLVRYHVQAGYDLLSTVDLDPLVLQAIYQHHERLDGSGYPLKLSGDAISNEAQIIATADMAEAITNDRPYRHGLGIDRALSELERCSAKTVRAEIIKACIELFRNEHYVFVVNDNEVPRQFR